MNRQKNKTTGQFPQQTRGKVIIAIIALGWLSTLSEECQAQRVIVAKIPSGQVAEKPLPPGSAANAPVILRGSVIEKRSITIRFKNKATNVSKIEVDRKSPRDRSWRTVRTYRSNVNRGAFAPSKIDLGPKPGATYVFQDVKLGPGTMYRYRIRATQANKPSPIVLTSAVRSITTKPLELPAAPSNLKVVGTTDSAISISWIDNADNELLFYYSYRKRGNGLWTGNNIWEINLTSAQLDGLMPNTQYEIKVWAANGDGQSGESNHVFARTKGSSSTPDTPSTAVTRTVYLKAQLIDKGIRPYLATWPAFGTISGYITKIEIPKVFGPTYQVFFVKPGHTTAECNTNPEATVRLTSGQSSSSSQLAEIFGTTKKKFPLTFVACVATSQGTVPDLVPIKITYIKTN